MALCNSGHRGLATCWCRLAVGHRNVALGTRNGIRTVGASAKSHHVHLRICCHTRHRIH